MNYQVNVKQDPNLVYAWFTGAEIVGSSIAELCYQGIYTVAGVPVNTPDLYIAGAVIFNSADGFVYSNAGSTSSPNFVVMDTGVPVSPGINQITGDVLAGPGSGSVSSTLDRIKGLLVNASMASAFTGEFIQYTGNPAKGWVNASHRTATAVAGVATVSGEGGNYIITTESLSLAPGDTYTLQIVGLILTGGSNTVTDISWGTATAGECKVVKKVMSGGAITFTIRNEHPTETCNGTFIINMLAV